MAEDLLMLPPCPHLPLPGRPLTAASMQEAGTSRGAGFYFLALECAQSRWLAGLPAQAVLLLNRALAADLRGDEPVLADWPFPYRAAGWIMRSRAPAQFIGNPRRHFQHLATRMVEPRKELRTWRAWACWALARQSPARRPSRRDTTRRRRRDRADPRGDRGVARSPRPARRDTVVACSARRRSARVASVIG